MGHQNILFKEILQFIPRHEFQQHVDRFNGDKRVRKLNCWKQFATLLFGQLTGHSSIRNMVTALNTQARYLYHLGLSEVRRSTLSDANESRNPKILEHVYYDLLNRTQSYAPKHHFRFKGKILAMDSSIINLCLNLCPWAQFHNGKGAIKLHTAIDLAGNLPTFMVMSPGKLQDIQVAKTRLFQAGTNIVFDRGYIDHEWLNTLNKQGVYFVTRMKKNVVFKVRRCFPKIREKGICADQEIRMKGLKGKKYTKTIRRISFRDPETNKHFVFLTNRFDLSAKTICNLYKARWDVELFFKTMKQQFQIEKFVGTTANAVMWQLWAAMIAYLLVSLIRFINKVKWSVPATMAALAVALFQKRHLKRLLEPMPTERCINIGLERQMVLQF